MNGRMRYEIHRKILTLYFVPYFFSRIFTMLKSFGFFFIMFFLFPGFIRAQDPGTETENDTLTRYQHIYLRHVYDSVIHLSTEDVLSGREYELYYPVTSTTPLLPQKRYLNGSVTIEGIRHSPVIIQYDTYLDQLIYFDFRHQAGRSVVPVMLNKYRVDAFELVLPGGRMKFRNLTFPDSVNSVGSGFFEVVYEGKTRYLIRYKSILAITGGNYIFTIRTRRYLENHHTVFLITGKKSLLKALADRKADIRKYIRQNRLHVRRAGKDEMRMLLRFYDHAEDQ